MMAYFKMDKVFIYSILAMFLYVGRLFFYLDIIQVCGEQLDQRGKRMYTGDAVRLQFVRRQQQVDPP